MAKVTTLSFRDRKARGEKITVLTAYDYPTAEALDEAGVDALLVGDSMGMAIMGYESTLAVTVDDILHLARSDVLVMGRSTMSVAVATLSSGVVILNGWDIKYPHEFIHAVPWRRDGSGKRDELLHQLKAADHANGIQQRRRRARDPNSRPGRDALAARRSRAALLFRAEALRRTWRWLEQESTDSRRALHNRIRHGLE